MWIDTIRFLITSKTLHKFLIDNDLVIKDNSRNFIINKYFEEKEIKQNRDYEVKFVEVGNIKNLSGYILIKQNLESVSISKSRKKKKNFYSEVIFAGLRQPTKHISLSTYEILNLLKEKRKFLFFYEILKLI